MTEKRAREVTFLHTADWQIGKPFAGCADDAKRHALQAERIAAIGRIGAAAREAGAAFVVVCGDLFDSPGVTKGTVSAAMGAIGKIGLPVFAIPGNHDHAGPGSIWEQPFFLGERDALAPNFTLLSSPAPHGRPDALLFPCPLAGKRAAADPAKWLRGAAETLDPADPRPRIVLAHGAAHGFTSEADDDERDGAPAERLDLAKIPEAYDYLALGDWHGLMEIDARTWYPGTPEPDRFPKGDAPRPGHCLVVTARRGAPPRVEPVETGRLRWHPLEFAFGEGATPEQLEARVDALVHGRVDGDLLHLTLSGALDLAARERLDRLIERLSARLLRLKWKDRTTVAPSAAELDALRVRPDPLIRSVAGSLLDLIEAGGDESETARQALRLLHDACAAEGGR